MNYLELIKQGGEVCYSPPTGAPGETEPPKPARFRGASRPTGPDAKFPHQTGMGPQRTPAQRAVRAVSKATVAASPIANVHILLSPRGEGGS